MTKKTYTIEQIRKAYEEESEDKYIALTYEKLKEKNPLIETLRKEFDLDI